MNATHTPAPWAVGSNGASIKIVDSDGKAIAMVTPRRDRWNGDLIAAAPELLSALTDLLDQLDGIGIPDWHGAEGLSLEQAHAAIAKAEGRSE